MIALITDFGSRDYYAGVVRGVIKNLHPAADLVDICHDVVPQSIVNAQYILTASHPWFPGGTVFYVVIDPGVGSGRRALIAKSRNRLYVLPDNGIISAVHDESLEFFAVDEERFPEPSATFHGRDIFAPVAARLDQGAPPEELGYAVKDVMEKPFPRHMAGESLFEGEVIHVDRFGNIITSIPAELVLTEDRHTFTLTANSGETRLVRVHTYSDLGPDERGIVFGSSGFTEIALNRGSAASALNIATGDPVKIEYERK